MTHKVHILQRLFFFQAKHRSFPAENQQKINEQDNKQVLPKAKHCKYFALFDNLFMQYQSYVMLYNIV